MQVSPFKTAFGGRIEISLRDVLDSLCFRAANGRSLHSSAETQKTPTGEEATGTS
jgi:hypothetical protein